jgi:hypothetical protein
MIVPLDPGDRSLLDVRCASELVLRRIELVL